MRTQPRIIRTLLEYLAAYSHVQKVILFGSRARGDEEERSDIDIAVEGSDITRREWLEMQEYMDEEAPTLLSIDLVRLESISHKLKENIEREGVVLYERQ